VNILVTGARAPIAAEIAMALAVSDNKVWVTDSLSAPVAAASPYIQGFLRLPAPRTSFRSFAIDLAAACERHSIEAIVPTSEEVFWLAGAAPLLPSTVDLRTSPFSTLASLHDKASFARMASSLGYGAPESIEISHPSDLAQLKHPELFVFKPVFSRFSTRTIVSPRLSDLSRLKPDSANRWLAQTRVAGRELCSYNVAAAGRILMHVGYEPGFRTRVAAGTYFSPVTHEPLRAMSERFVKATGFTGQISFDAIETPDGMVAIECNPRGTSGAHLASQRPREFAASLLGAGDGAPTPFQAGPRMLVLPLLLSQPLSWLDPQRLQMLRAARDAPSSAGIPIRAQARALAELAWLAVRLRVGIRRASTADFEWNGEVLRA
jgi:hypothetical protein